MMNTAEFMNKLGCFTGESGKAYTWSTLYPRFVLSEGAMFVAGSTNAFWLMDIIASHQQTLAKGNRFAQEWHLYVFNNKTAFVVCEDIDRPYGQRQILLTQDVAYTDFPASISNITLHAYYNKTSGIMQILLPGEH